MSRPDPCRRALVVDAGRPAMLDPDTAPVDDTAERAWDRSLAAASSAKHLHQLKGQRFDAPAAC